MWCLDSKACAVVAAGFEWAQDGAIELSVSGMFYGTLASHESIDLYSQQGHLSLADGMITYNGHPATMSELAKVYPGLSVVFINHDANHLGCYLKITTS